VFDPFKSTPKTEGKHLSISFGSRLQNAFDTQGHLCVGIDPSAQQLSSWGLPFDSRGIESFSKQIVDSCHKKVGIVKFQVAFFEQFGSAGFSVLEKLSSYASSAGLLVIADAKRGDIGTTIEGYAQAWLTRDAIFHADALTLSPYLGAEALAPAVDLAVANRKGVFILCATSNTEASNLQTSVGSAGKLVAKQIADYAARANTDKLGSVGLVIGANTKLPEFGLIESEMAQTPILAPGYGHQGARLTEAEKIFGSLAGNLICSASRSIAGTSPAGVSLRIQEAKLELSKGLGL
jgi:orotidine-5'-phosphate decarboxylase